MMNSIHSIGSTAPGVDVQGRTLVVIRWLLQRQGASFREVPILFVDRVRETTKINAREACAALGNILRLAVKELTAGIDRAPGVHVAPPVTATGGPSHGRRPGSSDARK